MPFVKGQSGNPGGRRKATKDDLDLAKACREKTHAALAVIERLMNKADSDTVRLRAAVTIIERGYGAAQVLPPGSNDPPPAAVPVTRTDASIPEPD